MKKKVNILVSGSTGQLGSEFRHLAKHYQRFKFTFKDRKGMNLASAKSIKNALQDQDYDVFINAGAYTAVDKAEQDQAMAEKVNGTALKHIANYASPNTKIIHISSDYVYHTNLDRPLQETDKVSPRGVYAKTKLSGEQQLLKKRQDALVVRTSWVYSTFGNNFVKTMLRLGKQREALTIVADQQGAPTYARDLAKALLKMIDNRGVKNYDGVQQRGIYNYSNLGLTNWSEFAQEIFRQAKIKCKVSDTTTKAYNAPAPRPLWSMMSKEKIQRQFRLEIPHWKESLKQCLQDLK